TGFLVGANDYLIKPVDAMELIVRVDSLTNLQASIEERLRMEAAWLQAQIKPHFLLNNLNSIISLSQMNSTRMIKLIEQFGNYLKIRWAVEVVDDIVVPPLSLQTLVENAVNHGILPKEGGGTVTIRVRNVAEGIEISISDDGIGMDEETIEKLLIAHPDNE